MGYTVVNGLDINIQKSTVPRIHCSLELTQELHQKGFSTAEKNQYLGVELSNNMNTTLRETFNKNDLKAIERCNLATTPSLPALLTFSTGLCWSKLPWHPCRIMSSLHSQWHVKTFNPDARKSFPSYGQKKNQHRNLLEKKTCGKKMSFSKIWQSWSADPRP